MMPKMSKRRGRRIKCDDGVVCRGRFYMKLLPKTMVSRKMRRVITSRIISDELTEIDNAVHETWETFCRLWHDVAIDLSNREFWRMLELEEIENARIDLDDARERVRRLTDRLADLIANSRSGPRPRIM